MYDRFHDIIMLLCIVFLTGGIFGVCVTFIKHLNAEEYAEAPPCVVTGDGRGQKKEWK